ncbi:MAG: winged helix-turn-helix domain-containing protein [Caulobacterales bacterium]|jgi:DNA-binding MarR family transcriptional regulator
MSRFSTQGIDEVIHGRLRLGIMAYLSTAGSASFTDIKGKVEASDGNLSAQLSKLEEAGYVLIEKRFVGKKPNTEVHLTEAGRSAWIAYLDQMRAMLATPAAE